MLMTCISPKGCEFKSPVWKKSVSSELVCKYAHTLCKCCIQVLEFHTNSSICMQYLQTVCVYLNTSAEP